METYRHKLLKKDYKTFFKQIENITLRCYKCSYIPKFYTNFSDTVSIFCQNHKNQEIISMDVINYIQTILNKHQCEICSKKNDLYFSKNFTDIYCGECKSKLSEIELSNLELNPYKKIDEYCLYHLEKYNYVNNLCDKCILNKNGEINLIHLRPENPYNIIKIKDMNNFLFSEKEIEQLKKDINYIETYINSLKFPLHFNNKEKEQKIILIYFNISFIRSLINTYEQMIKNNYINYNIIFNLRRIKIDRDYIYNSMNESFEICPFYNIAMNIYCLNNKYQNEINEKYFIQKKVKLVKTNETYMHGRDLHESGLELRCFKWYKSLNNDIIFWFYKNKIKIFDYNLNEFIRIKGFHNSTNRILNYLNYTFQVVDDYILIQKYSIEKFAINTFGIEFFDFQKFDLKQILNLKKDEHHSDSDSDKEKDKDKYKYKIYFDDKLKSVYFIFMREQKIIIFENKIKNNKKNKTFFYMKVIDIKYDFISNEKKIYKFFDNNIYILEKYTKLIEINLNTLYKRELEIKDNNSIFISDFLDLDDDNILLAINIIDKKSKNKIHNLTTSYFSFLNKNKFILEEKKIYFEKIFGSKGFIKIDQNQIFYDNDIWYYLIKEKDLIKINYIPFSICNTQYFGNYIRFFRNGKFYEIDEKVDYNDEEDLQLCVWNLYEISNNSKFIIEQYAKKKIELYHPDFSVKRYKNINFKNKILTCPYCPFIPYFEIIFRKTRYNYCYPIININCEIHGKLHYEIDDFVNNYNELELAICNYCGKKYNLFFYEKEGYYICKNCFDNPKNKYKIKGKLIDINNIYKCRKHLKDIKYTYNKCEMCLEENENEIIEEEEAEEEAEEEEKEVEKEKDVPQICKEVPEILDNIIFSENELNELKNKMEIIEAKINKYFNENIIEIKLNSNLDYFKQLFLLLNLYNSFFYTYVYLSKKNCLNYSIIYNLRTIKLLPNFNIQKKKYFFKIISIYRFLNGEINNKYSEEIIDNIFSTKYYYNNIDNIERIDDVDVSENNITFYPGEETYENNNLFHIMKDYHSKYIDVCINKIKNINYLCLYSVLDIQILSFEIKDKKCSIKLHQNIKFNQKLEFLRDYRNNNSNFFLQEEDGSKIYLLYKDRLIILSNNNLYFQIETVIRCDNNNYKFKYFDKYKNKIYILNEKNYYFTMIEINLKNFKIKTFNNLSYSDNFESTFTIINKYLVYNSAHYDKNPCIYIYDVNKHFIVNKIQISGKWIINKYKNKFLIFKKIVDGFERTIQFWKFENNKFIFLNEI